MAAAGEGDNAVAAGESKALEEHFSFAVREPAGGAARRKARAAAAAAGGSGGATGFSQTAFYKDLKGLQSNLQRGLQANMQEILSGGKNLFSSAAQ